MIKKIKKIFSKKIVRFIFFLLLVLLFGIKNTYANIETGSLNSQLTLQKCSVYDTSIFCNPQRVIGSLETFGNSVPTRPQLDFGTNIVDDKTAYILSAGILDISLDSYTPSSEGKYLKIRSGEFKDPQLYLNKTFSLTNENWAMINYTGINPFYCEYTYTEDESDYTGVCDVYFQKVSSTASLGTSDVFYVDFTGITGQVKNLKIYLGTPSKNYSNTLKETIVTSTYGNYKYLLPNTGYNYKRYNSNFRVNDNNIIAYAPPGYYFGNDGSYFTFRYSQSVVSQDSFSSPSTAPVLVFNSKGPNIEEIEANAKYQDEINKLVGIQNSNVGSAPTQSETNTFFDSLLNNSSLSDKHSKINELINSLIITPIEKIQLHKNISLLTSAGNPNWNVCGNPSSILPDVVINPEIPLWRDFSFEIPCMHTEVYNNLSYDGYSILGDSANSLQFWIDLTYTALLYYALANTIISVIKYSLEPDTTDFEVMTL